MYELVKVTVVASLLQRDADGKIIGEVETRPLALYSLEALHDWADKVPAEIASLGAEEAVR